MLDKIETFNKVTIVYLVFFTLLTLKYIFPDFPYSNSNNNFANDNLNLVIIILILLGVLYFYALFVKRFL